MSSCSVLRTIANSRVGQGWRRRSGLPIGFAACLVLLPFPAAAEQLPLWEAGAGVAVLSLPDYRGSDQRIVRTLPLPYLIYRGERLKADRDGIRTMLFDSDRVELNLSAHGTLPASSDNVARRGMPDLRPIVELGPALNLRLTPKNAASTLQLRFPLRAAVAVDTPLRHVGWIFSPTLSWHTRTLATLPGWNVSASAGPVFQDRRYNDTFYGVGASEVLTDRPAYRARGGYSGSQMTLGLSRRFPHFWVGAFLRYDHLGGAVFNDSPLIRKRSALAAGIGVSWIFGQSATMVEADQ